LAFAEPTGFVDTATPSLRPLLSAKADTEKAMLSSRCERPNRAVLKRESNRPLDPR
jgi:hypothetical protein